MLVGGLKIVLEFSKNDVRAEAIVNVFGRLVSVGIDLKSWKTSLSKRPFSVNVYVGPFVVSVVHLEKMNNYLDVLQEKSKYQDYTEM